MLLFLGTEGENDWKQHIMEAEKKFCDHYHGTFEVEIAEVEIASKTKDAEGKEQTWK